jgi:acyl-coenzyme A thioesterase PaaI-like protein
MLPANPDLSGEPGWTELVHPDVLVRSRSFISGEPDGDRVRVRYFRRDADGLVVGKAWFGPAAQGPPGHAHGGSMAAVLDEAMGAAAWIAGHPVLAVELTTRYRRRLPLHTTVLIEAWVERVEGRKVRIRGRLVDAAGVPFCDGEALMVALDAAQLEEFAITPLMERWLEWAGGRRDA